MYAIFKFFFFKLDAERAHLLACFFLVTLGKIPGALKIVSASNTTEKPVDFLGMCFRNSIGLAAGFDKDAKLVKYLPDLGFGFVEVGTVTLHPQAGNKRPRLFRFPKEKSLFNRMGFNSEGAGLVSERLKKARQKLPENFRVGVNIGKNKDTPNSEAADEYAVCCSFFESLADYIVINISSPNTLGLRDLQSSEQIKEIVERVRQVTRAWKTKPPILVKLAPELNDQGLSELASELPSLGVDGLVLTNTLAGEFRGQSGGWSGERLKQLSREALRIARARTNIPIISVGGIDGREEVELRLQMGAGLLQIYSSWVYAGPKLLSRMLSKD